MVMTKKVLKGKGNGLYDLRKEIKRLNNDEKELKEEIASYMEVDDQILIDTDDGVKKMTLSEVKTPMLKSNQAIIDKVGLDAFLMCAKVSVEELRKATTRKEFKSLVLKETKSEQIKFL
jgi:hypothetical protein